jgi:hypothetical protein
MLRKITDITAPTTFRDFIASPKYVNSLVRTLLSLSSLFDQLALDEERHQRGRNRNEADWREAGRRLLARFVFVQS